MRPLRVAMVAESEGPGGAGRSASQLRQALSDAGVDARLFTRPGGDEGSAGAAVKRSVAAVRAKVEFKAVEFRARDRTAWFSAGLLPDAKWAKIRRFAPDVVSLHWINAGHVGIETLPLYPGPMVWTLHDMWPFTGGCHVDEGCGRYRDACGACPVLGSSVEDDLSRHIWRRKRRAWRGLDMVFVAPSEWLATAVGKSSLFTGSPVVIIPRPIDTEHYHPADRRAARAALGLRPDALIVAAGAHGLFTDRNKGWDLLAGALRRIRPTVPPGGPEPSLLLFGEAAEGTIDVGAFRVVNLGPVDKGVVARVHNAADVVVVPSRQEAFGRVAAESLACGTPVVALRSPGAGPLVDHGVTGFVCEVTQEGLRLAIERSLDALVGDPAVRTRCRQQALSSFSSDAVAVAYRSLFETVASGADVTDDGWRTDA